MIKFIENLLKSPPPQFDGEIIDYKSLGEVCELKRGKIISKEYIYECKNPIYPVYSSQTINNGEIGKIDTYDYDQEAITWTTDGSNAGTVFYRYGRFSITNICGIIDKLDDRILYKFLYYWLSIETKKYVVEGMGNPKLMSNKMAKIVIPIPPMRVQEEIVRILDMFSELISELSAELELRKKQYYYYREKLLTFTNDTAEFLPLGEVVRTITAPTKLKKEAYCNSGRTPIIDQSVTFISAYTDEDLKTLPSGEYVIFGDHSEHIKYVDFSFIQGADGLKILQVKAKDILTKYIYYAFLNFYKRENTYKRHWLTAKETIIPIPPISEQERIVAILDKFDSLVNSLSEGLPAEINLRQKQYEYYRNALLSFN